MSTARQRGNVSVEVVLLTPVLVLMAVWAAGIGRQTEAVATVRLAADHAARAATMVSRPAMVDVARRTASGVLADRPASCTSPHVGVEVEATRVIVEVGCLADGRRISATSTEVIDVYRGGS
jgi:hypothetical protein